MLLGSVLLYFVVAPRVFLEDLTHAGVAGYVPSFTAPARRRFQSHPLGFVGRDGDHGLLEPGHRGPGMANPRARFHACSGKAIAAPTAPPWTPSKCRSPGWSPGLIPITIGMVIIQYLAFHISIPLGLLAVALAFVVSLVCCRATGETDTTPVGPMGKVTQLLYAVLPGAQGVASINLMAAGATSAAGGAAADLLTDLKSGYILGANPRKQFIAQFVGIFFGTGGHRAGVVRDGAGQEGAGSLQPARHLYVEGRG